MTHQLNKRFSRTELFSNKNLPKSSVQKSSLQSRWVNRNLTLTLCSWFDLETARFLCCLTTPRQTTECRWLAFSCHRSSSSCRARRRVCRWMFSNILSWLLAIRDCFWVLHGFRGNSFLPVFRKDYLWFPYRLALIEKIIKCSWLKENSAEHDTGPTGLKGGH